MSEDQTYEFLSLDKPLTTKEQAALRKVSSRAEISANRFFNEYSYGDLRADPAMLVEKYFDVHLHVASFGTRRFMLRLPVTGVDAKRLRAFFPGGLAVATATAHHVVIDLQSDPDDGYETWRLPPDMLAELVPLRTELLRGDLRPAYLAWLLAVQFGHVEDGVVEPEVPRGLADLSAPQTALVDLFDIDDALIAAAATASDPAVDERDALTTWALAQSARVKDGWVRRIAADPELALGGELLRAFRAKTKPVKGRRTAGELRVASGGGLLGEP